MKPRLLVLVVALIMISASVFAQQQPTFRVVVKPKNPTASVDRKFVEDVFLKKVSSWPNGESLRPVDLPSSSPTRQTFTTAMLGRTVDEVRRYWQQRIFSGRDVPPPERTSDEEVIKYVLEHEGGVGYVSTNTNLSGTRVLAIQ